MKSKFIFCFSDDVKDVQFLSILRPESYIFFPHHDLRVLRRLSLYYSVIGVHVGEKVGEEEMYEKCM